MEAMTLFEDFKEARYSHSFAMGMYFHLPNLCPHEDLGCLCCFLTTNVICDYTGAGLRGLFEGHLVDSLGFLKFVADEFGKNRATLQLCWLQSSCVVVDVVCVQFLQMNLMGLPGTPWQNQLQNPLGTTGGDPEDQNAPGGTQHLGQLIGRVYVCWHGILTCDLCLYRQRAWE